MSEAIQKINSVTRRSHVATIIKNGNYHRHLIVNGEVVSTLEVYEYKTSLGKTAIRTAGIGNVSTREGHRKNGYMNILMEDTVHYLKDEGFHISMLIGIPHFYHKFGYVVNMPIHKQKLDFDYIHNVAVDMSDIVISQYSESDNREIAELFNRNNGDRPGTIIRDPETFAGFTRGSDIGTVAQTRVFRNSAGELIGYYVADQAESTLTISELECKNRSDYYRIMNQMQGMGKKMILDDIDFVMAEDHPFMKFIQRYGATVNTEFPQNGMMMSKICNLIPLMEEMLPELEQRLQNRLGNYSGSLSVVTDLGVFTLSANNGSLTLSKETCKKRFMLSQKELMQLMSGYRELDDILLTPDCSVVCDDYELASIFHPERTPFLWPTDHF